MTMEEEQSGTVTVGSVSRLQFSGPGDEGVTVKICIEKGEIVVYGSYTISSPSKALHDFSKELRAGTDKCFTTSATLDDVDLHKEVTKGQGGNVTVYITIEGLSEKENQFSVNSSVGKFYSSYSQ